MSNNILTTIQENMPTFSKGQKLIANYILNSYDKAAFMTASKLGRTVNVSESTVVRFAAELGFDGYPSMQKTLQEIIRNKLTSIQRIEVSNDHISNHDVLYRVMQSDIEKIRATVEATDLSHFEEVVQTVAGANKVYILGIRSARSLAEFMSFYFRFMFDDVICIDTSAMGEVYEQILPVKPGDVFLGLSFPRYSNRTVRAMKYAREQGAKTVAITDSTASPLCDHADYTLFAKSDMASFVDSLVAPMSLVNALIVAVSRIRQEKLETTLRNLETIWAEYDVYSRSGNE